jgi:hypothetical protein
MGKKHMSEIQVLIGYSEVKYPLNSEQEAELQKARYALEHTSPKELVEIFLTYHLSGLGPKRPTSLNSGLRTIQSADGASGPFRPKAMG